MTLIMGLMMNTFLLGLDGNGRGTDIVPIPSHTVVIQLAPGTGRSLTVPAGAKMALFSATGNFWLKAGAVPLLPVADILDGSAPELNPAGRKVEGVTSLGLVAPAACAVSIGFYG